MYTMCIHVYDNNIEINYSIYMRCNIENQISLLYMDVCMCIMHLFDRYM